MAYEFYMTVDGTKQGKFKGDSIRKSHEAELTGLGFEYSVKSPRDIATGQASGKRQHNPLKVTLETGPASPQFFQSCISNEVLKKVVLNFFKTDKSGKEYNYYTITLTDATVSEFREHTGTPGADDTAKSAGGAFDAKELDEVFFTFRQIELENKDAKTAAQDDWHSGSK